MITEKLQVPTPTKEEYIKVFQCTFDNGNAWANGEYDTLLNDCSTWKKHEEDNLVKDNNKAMNIKKFVKTLTLSKEDKLLREQGLQNDSGDFTDTAKELIIDKLVEENKAYLVEIATQLKEEDKK